MEMLPSLVYMCVHHNVCVFTRTENSPFYFKNGTYFHHDLFLTHPSAFYSFSSSSFVSSALPRPTAISQMTPPFLSLS